MDGLIMDQRISLLVVGQDVLKSKAEVIMCNFQVSAEVNVYDFTIYNLFHKHA